MSIPDQIVIQCSDSEDTLTVTNAALGGGRVGLYSTEHGGEPVGVLIHLDEAKARELFNWLGRWLHSEAPRA